MLNAVGSGGKNTFLKPIGKSLVRSSNKHK